MNNSITVVIPLYNKENYIRRALDSVLQQTYPASEIVVIDDGSSDRSSHIVKDEYPFVRLISQENSGVSAARNKGLLVANNSLVAFLDADDQYCTDHLYHLNQLYNKYPNFSLYGNNYNQVSTYRPQSKEINYKIRNYVAEYAVHGGVVNSSTALINKANLSDIKVFPEGVAMGEDVFTWVLLSSINGGGVPVSSYIGAIYHDDTDGLMSSGRPKPYPEILKANSPLKRLDKKIVQGFEKHFLEDYIRSIYKYGNRRELLLSLLKVRKLFVLKFALKLFLPDRVIQYIKKSI
ncbi:TPA: glycosyltransferase [Vibrio vulnificus]|nr:glycosyltransferase [Vibrio vulnificus]